MTNLFFSIYTACIALFSKVQGWRYPLINYVEGGLKFRHTSHRIEAMILGRLRHSTLISFLNKPRALGREFVVVAIIKDGHLCANLYRVVYDREDSPSAKRIYNPLRGQDGTFTFYVNNAKMYVAHTPATVRRRSYIACEPFMGYRVPLSQNELDYVQDALHTEGPLLNRVGDAPVYDYAV